MKTWNEVLNEVAKNTKAGIGYEATKYEYEGNLREALEELIKEAGCYKYAYVSNNYGKNEPVYVNLCGDGYCDTIYLDIKFQKAGTVYTWTDGNKTKYTIKAVRTQNGEYDDEDIIESIKNIYLNSENRKKQEALVNQNNELLKANADLIKELAEVIGKFNALTPGEKSIVSRTLKNNDQWFSTYVF